MQHKVNDLRSALALLRTMPGQLVSTKVEVDPEAELSGVYRYVGAGGTVKRPTKEGPAMVFENVKGHPGARVAIGLMASRRRVAALLGVEPERLGKRLWECVDSPLPPVFEEGPAPCQEVVHLADEEGFDLNRLVPAPTNTPQDAGPYITLGMCYAAHPDTGRWDVTIHRLCIQSRDTLSIFFTPGARHIGAMAERAEQLGRTLPISISIGVDPAISISSCFEPPTTPLGYDELSVAGALRGEPVKLCRCLSVDCRAIALAEYVIEGEVLPHVRIQEDQNRGTGFAMPEFPGPQDFLAHSPYIHPSVMFRRETLEQGGGYSQQPRYFGCEDYQLFFRLHAQGKQGWNLPAALVGYWEDRDSYRRRTVSRRLREAALRWEGLGALGLPVPAAALGTLRPLGACLVPGPVLRWVKERRHG